MDNKVIGNIVGVPNPRSDWAQEDKTKADYIKNKPSVYTTEQVDDLLDDKVDKEEGKGLSSNDFTNRDKEVLAEVTAGHKELETAFDYLCNELNNWTESRPVYNGDVKTVDDGGNREIEKISVVTYVNDEAHSGNFLVTHTLKDTKAREELENKVDKEEGKGLSANDFADEYKDMLDSRFVKLPSSGYAAKTNLMTSQAVYQMIKNTAEKWDTETFESLLSDFIEPLANSIPMQKIAEITTVDGATKTTIITDAEENLFKLDEIYVFINTSSAMPEAKTWFCYVNGNNSADTEYYLFSFSTKTTGNIFLLKSERVCEKLWFTQSTNNLISGAFASQYYTGSRLPAVDYITSITLHHSGIPAGSKIIVCGRKVVE